MINEARMYSMIFLSAAVSKWDADMSPATWLSLFSIAWFVASIQEKR